MAPWTRSVTSPKRSPPRRRSPRYRSSRPTWAPTPTWSAGYAAKYEKHLRVLHAGDDGAHDEPALRYEQQYAALRLAVIARKRATVVRLRDERRIDDTVLRQVQDRLDIEEVRLARRDVDD
jgi:hypothetical protein